MSPFGQDPPGLQNNCHFLVVHSENMSIRVWTRSEGGNYWMVVEIDGMPLKRKYAYMFRQIQILKDHGADFRR